MASSETFMDFYFNLTSLFPNGLEDISTAMFLIFSIGTALWLAYGILIHSFPVIAANGVTLLLSFLILAMKWKWRRRLGRR